MKYFTHLALLSSTLMLVGCGDTDNSNSSQQSESKSFSSLQRELSYLTDTDKRALYTFDNDRINMSNCDSDCQSIWPLFRGGNTESTDIAVVEGSDQLAYRGHPLYYYINDTQEGDVNGDNVRDVWHLVYALENTNDSQTLFSDDTMQQTYLTDPQGRTLYTFDNDTNNTSNCYGACEDLWPVFYAETLQDLPSELSASDFTTISRDAQRSTTGVLQQTAYKGKPLYYYTPDDQQSGVVKGDWFNGVWHVVELSAEKTSTEATPYTAEAAALGEAVFTDPQRCARCHGVDGQTPPLGIDNVIARYGDAELIAQKLIDMRDNGNPQQRDQIMVDIASGFSDEAIVNLSAFIATLKK